MAEELTPILTDSTTLRNKIHNKVVDALAQTFPISMKNRDLTIENIRVDKKDYSPEDQKKALMTGGSLNEIVKGTLVLKDKEGNKLDESHDFTLVHVPYLTERHTVILDGNEYQIANQIRRKPGVYTQRAENGELKTIFNTTKGRNFNIGFNDKKGTFNLEYGTSNIPLYSVLKILGAGDEDIRNKLGPELASTLKSEVKDHNTIVNKFYSKIEHPAMLNNSLTPEAKEEIIRNKLGQAGLDPEVTKYTLNHPYDRVNAASLLTAAKKLVDVNKGIVDTDDTDSLTFKTFHAVDDFLAERIRLSARQWAPKAKFALNSKMNIKENLRPAPFTDGLKKFVITSQLSSVPTGINPIELIDHSVKVTALGEGGIPNDRAIPLAARLTHSTHFGALDPIRTPESKAAGVDVRASIYAHRDDKGNLYTYMKNVKTGKLEPFKAGALIDHVVAFPNQKIEGLVDAFVKGEVKKVPANLVEYQLPNVQAQYSPATTLIPMIHNIQGNRAIMGSKMGTQALPLVQREASFVQSKSEHPDGHSFETLYGHMIVPTAPVNGTIKKIEKGFIYIKPGLTKKAFETDEVYVDKDNNLVIEHYISNPAPKQRPFFYDDIPKKFQKDIKIEKSQMPDGRTLLASSISIPLEEAKKHPELKDYVSQTTSHGWFGAAKKASIEDELNHDIIFDETEAYAHALKHKLPIIKIDDHDDSFNQALELLNENNTKHVLTGPGLHRFSGLNKISNDRPVILQKRIGPHTFNIELLKGSTSESGTPVSEDYGHLPGYIGPDGDSLDFFVGDEDSDKSVIGSFEKQKQINGKWTTTDKKYVVGLPMEEYKNLREKLDKHPSPGAKYVNDVFFKDWDELQNHIDKHHSIEKTAADDLIKVPYQQYFPFPSKTFLHHELDVKPGDSVKQGQRLGDSNFTRNGTLALGKNLLVAYMPYHGFNSNDATVISESCSKKLTSEHMYREVYPVNSQIEFNLAKHKQYYGVKYTPSQYSNLDTNGIIKKGSKVNPKDLLVAGLTKTQLQGTDLILGKLGKALTQPYKEVNLTWEHGTPGEVVDVVRTNSQIAILVKTLEQMNVGDKLAGRYGNKGVIAKIIPDHEMIKDEAGRPIDLIITSASVVSRINPAQIIETAVGKVVEKTGKPIVYDNSEQKNAVQWAKDLLKEHKVKDKEIVFDPITNRQITGPDGKGVLVGRQYIYKLFKSTDTNFSGHGVGPYDLNEQPVKVGGDESAKGIGKMEFDALLAHNARNFLRDASTIRGQKNEDFWKAIQLGLPLPQNKPSFAFNKFTTMIEGTGLKVNKQGSKFTLLPMSDAEILKRSAGAIENNKTLLAKNLAPEKGGLFDPRLTGGPQGTLFSHIELNEPIPNPIFFEPVRRLLGFTEKQFEDKLKEKGGAWFKQELSKINVPQKIQELTRQLKVVKGPDLNNVVKQIKYLKNLENLNKNPAEAYVISKIPVIPPVFRPITPQPNDPSTLMISDANKLYAHVMDANTALKSTVLDSDLGKHRELLYNSVGALYGTDEVKDEELRGQKVKGFLKTIAGVGTPKGGFFQRKLMRRTQDVSGRGTIVPDPNLNMDEVGLPEEMLWKMFNKLILARLVRTGYPALTAKELVEKRAPAAKNALMEEIKIRPVLLNRAPTLHRWSIISAYAKPTQGKTIRLNPFAEKGMNADYDGDTLQIHAPVTDQGIEDAKKMTLSNLLLADHTKNKILVFPQHEAIIGATMAANTQEKATPDHVFETKEDAIRAYQQGKIKLTDTVEIKHE